MDMTAGETDFEKDGIPRAFDCNLDTPTYLFVRGDERQPRTSKPLAPGLPAILQRDKLDIHPVTLPPTACAPGLRPVVLRNHLVQAERQLAAALDALERARKTFAAVEDKTKREDARRAVVIAEKALAVAVLEPDALNARAAADQARYSRPPATNAKELARKAAHAERQIGVARAEEAVARAEREAATTSPKAEHTKKLAASQAALAAARKLFENSGETYTSLRGSLKTLESNLETEASRNKPFPTTSTGRRSALARWLTDAKNPLTARVAVNHIWARHFGKPLVSTVFDFGRKGAAPSHPELLDFLAVELRKSGWSMKRLHRLIVTSDAYQRSSASVGAEANRKADSENR